MAAADLLISDPLTQTATPRWRVLWTQSNCEQLVRDQLVAQGFDVFLPIADAWCRRGGVRRLSPTPVFRGYVFLRHAMDKATYLTVYRTRGLVRILGESWDRLDAVPDAEMQAIQRLVGVRVPMLPHPYLQHGQRVRITRGPLTDLEGFVVRVNEKKGLLVVSIKLLQRSVAVELDCTALEVA
jgi:transcription antitermination factor NusG